jgi:hypothetical protein
MLETTRSRIGRIGLVVLTGWRQRVAKTESFNSASSKPEVDGHFYNFCKENPALFNRIN